MLKTQYTKMDGNHEQTYKETSVAVYLLGYMCIRYMWNNVTMYVRTFNPCDTVGDLTTENLAEFPTALADSVRGAEHKAASAYEGKPGQRCNHRTYLQLHKANKKLQKEEFCDQWSR